MAEGKMPEQTGATREELASFAEDSASRGGRDRDLVDAGAPSDASERYRDAARSFADRFLPMYGWRRLLHLGAGSGDIALVLAKRGYDVTLVDRDVPAFRFARYRLQRSGVPAHFLEIEAASLIAPHSFDAVFCSKLQAESAAAETARIATRAVRWGGLAIFEQVVLGELQWGSSSDGHDALRGLTPTDVVPGDSTFKRRPRWADLAELVRSFT